jgi:hypothetical protein
MCYNKIKHKYLISKKMKKTLIVATLLVFGISSQALAVNTNSQSQGNSKSSDKVQQNSNVVAVPVQGIQAGNAVKTNEKNAVKNQGENVQMQTQEKSAVQTKDNANTEDKIKNNKGQNNAELHRNVVANFVQSLLAVAEKEGGIGQEIKTIANWQNENKNRAADLIYAVENRSKVKTFFIGTSYKNLGELRSQMVQTQKQIEELKQLAEKATVEQNRIELQAQIQILEQEQSRTNDFIAQNENKFSLLGWAVRLFR